MGDEGPEGVLKFTSLIHWQALCMPMMDLEMGMSTLDMCLRLIMFLFHLEHRTIDLLIFDPLIFDLLISCLLPRGRHAPFDPTGHSSHATCGL